MAGEPDRYEGKPLLRLLECYVLRAIGALDAEHAQSLVAMTPQLQRVYGVGGDWPQVVEAVMQFPREMPQIIRQIWDENVAAFRAEGETPDPQDFAEDFVDENFAPEG